MMFNRSIQVKMVKPAKDDTVEDTSFNDKATVIAVIVESAIKKIAFTTLSYVVLDTARQVMITKAQKK